MSKQTQCPLPGKPHICKREGRWCVAPNACPIDGDVYVAALGHVAMRNGEREMTAVRVGGVRYPNAWDGLAAMGVPAKRRGDVLRKLRSWGYVRWVTSHNSLANWRERRIEWCL
ncbi:hypothetical protein XccvBFoX4_gp84 [Xanthomonas phage FoX4]|uniref:Uncharacterized protein n=1 Tax=Xanthomonas phage FoX4 TaxID=2723900 RepID=A0A858WP52_9CAUD|nr:hypothetical protein KNU97_gp84 [Xanthomonas phage FoX4]QJI53038.1 hypothetical protein XccvBFoX4_gp84 [Xanthomonas phage FoX4]